MKRSMCLIILLSIPMVFLCGTDQKPFTPGRFELGPDTFMTMDLDPAWVTRLTVKPRVATEISISHPDHPQEKCRIYVIPQTVMPDPASLQTMLRDNGRALLQKALETDFTFIPLPGQKGYYYVLTDKSPKPGEPPLLSRGGLVTTRHLILFTHLFESRESAFFRSLIKAFSSARVLYPQS